MRVQVWAKITVRGAGADKKVRLRILKKPGRLGHLIKELEEVALEVEGWKLLLIMNAAALQAGEYYACYDGERTVIFSSEVV